MITPPPPPLSKRLKGALKERQIKIEAIAEDLGIAPEMLVKKRQLVASLDERQWMPSGWRKPLLEDVFLRIVEILKGNKKEEMYLYVDQKEGLRQVPDDLLSTFGQTESVMVLPLTQDKKLARVEAADVLEAIEQQGYFLQMPPPPEALLQGSNCCDGKGRGTIGRHSKPRANGVIPVPIVRQQEVKSPPFPLSSSHLRCYSQQYGWRQPLLSSCSNVYNGNTRNPPPVLVSTSPIVAT